MLWQLLQLQALAVAAVLTSFLLLFFRCLLCLSLGSGAIPRVPWGKQDATGMLAESRGIDLVEVHEAQVAREDQLD